MLNLDNLLSLTFQNRTVPYTTTKSLFSFFFCLTYLYGIHNIKYKRYSNITSTVSIIIIIYNITDQLRIIVGRINDDDENDEIKNDIGEDK